MAKKAEQEELVHEAPKVYCGGKMTHIGKIKPNPENPNVHPEEQMEVLAGILRVNGWRSPIVVSKLSGMVVKGHGRLQTALWMKLDAVPVETQEYADSQAEYADMIADNSAARLAFVDAFKLGNIIKKISAEWQKTLGYQQEEINLIAAAEYVAPEKTDRKFLVLETLKLTKEDKAIIGGAVQKYCLRLGKEYEWGEALAAICMAWQVMVLPGMAQAEVAKTPKPAAKPAPATPRGKPEPAEPQGLPACRKNSTSAST